jgi:hypothetical protein
VLLDQVRLKSCGNFVDGLEHLVSARSRAVSSTMLSVSRSSSSVFERAQHLPAEAAPELVLDYWRSGC